VYFLANEVCGGGASIAPHLNATKQPHRNNATAKDKYPTINAAVESHNTGND
jgi:hypothetical protein